MSYSIIIKFDHLSKQYRLSQIGGTTLRDELQRFSVKLHHREDPTKRIGAHDYKTGETFLALDDVSFEVKPFFLVFYLYGREYCWTPFLAVVEATSNTFIRNQATMDKVYYPRLVSPIATVFSQLISFVIQLALFLIV